MLVDWFVRMRVAFFEKIGGLNFLRHNEALSVLVIVPQHRVVRISMPTEGVAALAEIQRLATAIRMIRSLFAGRRLASSNPPMRSKGQSCPNSRAPAEERFEKWRGGMCMHTIFVVYITASKTVTLKQFSRGNPVTRPGEGPAWDHAHSMGVSGSSAHRQMEWAMRGFRMGDHDGILKRPISSGSGRSRSVKIVSMRGFFGYLTLVPKCFGTCRVCMATKLFVYRYGSTCRRMGMY
jgi:hypothetical protein